MATETFADVAIPVPLRRTFTYRVPEKLLGKVQRGSRVAVAFQRRKVPAIVTALHQTPPDVARIVTIAGLIEPEPLYDEELLGFLEEAAKYYFHPLGEVLRAAAPAVPTGAMSRLRAGGFLAADETLPGAKIAERTELYYSRVGSREGVRLGAAQARFFEAIEEGVEVPLSHLRKAFPRARSLGRALTEKGLIHVDERLMRGTLFQAPVRRDAPPALTPAQQIAAKAIREGLHTSGQFLLHGVTGSGKTEVYLDAIATCLQGGRGALVLVPEIALTPQLVGRFRARLGDDFAVLHSALTPRERDDAWRQLRSGELRLVVGARSALLAPVPNLGLIVVDEEHDGSYKQEDGFRYNARDMALLRAHRAGAVALLGSATPSIESKHRTESRSTLLTLPARAGGQPMPTVEVLDMRRHGSRPGRHHLLSGPLEAALEQCLERKEQAILFLNRRGFSPSVRCTACGELRECPSCSVALTLHQREGRLRCHYCDYRAPIPERCPACGADALEHMGLGTEQLESMLTENFPGARVGRLDRDVASGRSIEAILKRFRARELDVLVGTQMVTKGHDVPGVTLVGVLAADQSLDFPDFRANERTFQLLAQVAGRAGRGERPGRVIFQTYQPEHPAIAAAAKHDYHRFFAGEIAAREELAYPPFGHMAAVRVDHPKESRAEGAIRAIAAAARQHPAARELRVELLGPTPAPLARLRGRYRYRFFLRSVDRRALRGVAAVIARAIDEASSGVRASLDMDPVSMM